jgi:ribonuclease HII
MVQMDAVYPGYGFAESKGYGSAAHMDAIRRLGLTPIHRRSFCRNVLAQA